MSVLTRCSLFAFQGTQESSFQGHGREQRAQVLQMHAERTSVRIGPVHPLSRFRVPSFGSWLWTVENHFTQWLCLDRQSPPRSCGACTRVAFGPHFSGGGFEVRGWLLPACFSGLSCKASCSRPGTAPCVRAALPASCLWANAPFCVCNYVSK